MEPTGSLSRNLQYSYSACKVHRPFGSLFLGGYCRMREDCMQFDDASPRVGHVRDSKLKSPTVGVGYGMMGIGNDRPHFC